MINGETGSLSMDVKVPLDKGVRCSKERTRVSYQEGSFPVD